MKKAAYLTIVVFLFTFAAAAALVFILRISGIKEYVVMSGSMGAAMDTGSIAFVNTKKGYEHVNVGDIVVFKESDGSVVAHRAQERRPEGIVTKGDANNVSDGITTTEENYCGSVIFSVPYLGYLVAAAGFGRDRIFTLISAAVVILLLSIVRQGRRNLDDSVQQQ